MDSMNAWKEKFPLSTSCTLQEALKNQWIKETEYQEWAAQYYQLPILKDSFFEEYSSSADFLDKIQPIANPSAIPFLEWNNILYVACLEPQEIPTDQKTVLFIVSLKNMETLWKNIKPSVKDLTLQEQTTSELLDLSIQKEQIKKNILKKKNNDDIEFKHIHPLKAILLSLGDWFKILIHFITTEKQEVKQSPFMAFSHSHKKNKKLKPSKKTAEPAAQTPKKEKHQIPFLNKTVSTSKKETPIALDIDDKNSTSHSNNIKTPAEEEEKLIPLNLNKDSKKSALTQKQNPKDLEKDTALTSIALQDENHENLNTLPEDSDFYESRPSESKKENNKDERVDPPPTPIALDKESKNQPLQNPQEIPESNDEALYHKEEDANTPMNKASNSFVILDQNKTSSLDQLSLLRRPLEETKKYVNSYILFVFKKDLFIPYKWSHHLKSQKKVPGTIKKPSIFRIVYTSKQAYFGHIAPILANNAFFNQWGFETLPKHILLIPFLDAKKQTVLGGYLGISEIKSLPIKILNAVEQILEPLNSHYEDGSLLKKVS